MFKCGECGHIFEYGEEKRWTESYGEELCGCPICEGGFREIEPCLLCGSYNHNFDEAYCEVCKNDVKGRMEKFLDKEFTPEEKVLLNIIYDGEEL
jgi:hypothetical protein